MMIGSAALADTSPPQESATEGLPEVVVTAERRPEYAKDVPLAVTSISSDTVSDLSASGEDIRVLAARVPSLNIESSFGRTYPRFYIRGLGNSDYTYNAQQPVSVVTDDVVLENPIIKAFPIFDIQGVEVLRGPQGTLFGRNTPAGVVKIDTVKPGDSFTGYADLSYGTYNTVNFDGAIGGPIVPGILDFRFSVLEERRDDWVTNTNPDTQYHKGLEGYTDTAGRFQLLYKPNDTLDVLWSVDGRGLDGTARLFRADIIQKGTNNLVPGFNIDQIDTNGDNYQNLGSWGTHLNVDEDFGVVTLSSISAYEHGSVRSRGDVSGGNFVDPPPAGTVNVTGTGFPDETSDSIPGLDQITEELRLTTNGTGPYSNQGGFFYFHEYLHIDDFDYAPNGAQDIVLNQTQSTESFGIFDSAQYKVTDALTLAAGLRFSTDSKHYSVECTLTCLAPPVSAVSTSDSDVTWNVSATYAITPDINVYGRIATGYLAPALDGRNIEYDFGYTANAALTEAKAENTTSYEIGLKSTFFDHKALFNLTAFSWVTDDLQLTADGGSGNTTTLLNAKKAIGEGIESEIELKPLPQLLLTGTASYNFTQIQDPNLVVSGCGGGCTMESPVANAALGTYYINHNSLPQAPRWILDATAKYTLPLTQDTELYAMTDWSYRSSVNFFLYEAVEFTGQPLLLGGARIGYVDKAHGFEVAGYVRNILDEIKVTGAIDFDNLTGFVNDPRIVGVEARYRF
jgi:iron complex outermembrane receptor protein